MALAGISLLAGTASAAPVDDALPQTAPWGVAFEKDACHLTTQFGEGKNRVVMRLTRYSPGDIFDLLLQGKSFDSRTLTHEVHLDFGLASKPSTEWAVAGASGDLPIVMMTNVRLDAWRPEEPGQEAPAITPEQEATVAALKVSFQNNLHRAPVRLRFGALAQGLTLLRQCTDRLVRSWGYDPAVQVSRPLKPASVPQSWVNNSDYPTQALRAGLHGVVKFRLDVDPAGKVAGCHILARTAPDAFSDITCELLTRRAKFIPALDAEGKPVKAYFLSTFRWL